MKVILTEGARTHKVIEFMGGWMAWQRARVITYMEASCTPAEAHAHISTYPEDGCVVLAKRGPKGGWPYVAFITWVYPRHVSYAERRGMTMHLGRMTPKGAGW